MNFLIDAQLPPALCGWLRERGHQAVHRSLNWLASGLEKTVLLESLLFIVGALVRRISDVAEAAFPKWPRRILIRLVRTFKNVG